MLMFRHAAAVMLGLLWLALPAHAFAIKEVKSPGGITAWLVEDHTIPLIAMEFSFRGGAAGDPAGKEGLAYFLSGMLDEGAGDLDSQAFKKRAADLGVRLSFSASRDGFGGSFRALSGKRDESFDLLRLSLNATRFDPEPLNRVRGQITLNLAAEDQDPDAVAGRALMRSAFGDHPYGRSEHGTAAAIASITADDLSALKQRLFTRDGLLIGVVGDIDAATLGPLLDRIFGSLPATSGMPVTPAASVKPGPGQEVIGMNVPQSTVQLVMPGLLRSDPDFIPAFVMNAILGGSGFGSRLMTEVREKRGLAYHAGSQLWPMDQAGLLTASAATRNDKVRETIDVIRTEIRKMAESGPSEEELASVKTYLTGSYPLRFDSSGAIAGQLLGLQQQKLGIDYIDRRNSLVEAVTMEDVRRTARRLLTAEPLITIVGQPVGLK